MPVAARTPAVLALGLFRTQAILTVPIICSGVGNGFQAEGSHQVQRRLTRRHAVERGPHVEATCMKFLDGEGSMSEQDSDEPGPG
jgi:hypothetical protein